MGSAKWWKMTAAAGVMAGVLGGCAGASDVSREPPKALTLPAPLSQAKIDELWAARGCNDDERGGWFRDAKFGAFIHFGLYSELGGYYEGKGPYDPAEQIMGLGDRKMVIPWQTYRDKVGGAFNPEKFDAASWVSLVKKAGQKYIIVTTKHHDGFCMYDSAVTPAYNVVRSTPFKRDVIKELAAECRKQGIEFCLYYSIGDWTEESIRDKAKYPTYKDYMYAQLQEILTNYGPVKMLWLDNYWYVNNQWPGQNDAAHAKGLYAFCRDLSPMTLIDDRCGRGASSTDGDYATPENQLRGSRQSRYFEVVMTDTKDDNWGWVKGATNYRSAGEIIRNLVDSTSKGGNFVLNVGPMGDGEFSPEHVAMLEKIGAWTSVNGEAIYARVPAAEVSFEKMEGLVAYATKAKDSKTYYVEVVSWPTDGSGVKVKFERTAEGAGGIAGMKGTLLDPSLAQGSAGWAVGTPTMDGGAMTVVVTPPAKKDPSVTVVKLVVGK